MPTPPFRVAEVFRTGWTAYCGAHRVPSRLARVVRQIRDCRTAALGGRLHRCDACGARRLLERANVRRLVICHHGSLLCPAMGNRANVEAVASMPDLLRAYCAVNGNYPAQIEQDVAAFDGLHPQVFVGFKLLSDYHRVPVTDARCRPAWELAQARRLPVLLHTWGGSAYNGYPAVREVAERYPEARILLGHSLHGEWDRAVEMARTFPNVYLELTAVPDERGPVEKFVREAGSRKVIFGTDFPWFGQNYYIGALLGAGLDDEALRDILYRNARRLLGETPVEGR
jgi:predicted TIM-barrel fold metal-dependent hydrolase